MSELDFTAALEDELRLRGLAFSRADVLAFVEACWPLVADDPSPARWAAEFAAAAHAASETPDAPISF